MTDDRYRSNLMAPDEFKNLGFQEGEIQKAENSTCSDKGS